MRRKSCKSLDNVDRSSFMNIPCDEFANINLYPRYYAELARKVEEMAEMETFILFAAPVINYFEEEQQDQYLSVVEKPMDLGTVAHSTRSGEYLFLWQFIQDVDLIRSNCILYYGDSGELVPIANQINSEMATIVSSVIGQPFTTTMFNQIVAGTFTKKAPDFPCVDLLAGMMTYIPEDKLGRTVRRLIEHAGIEIEEGAERLDVDITALSVDNFLWLWSEARRLSSIAKNRRDGVAKYVASAAESYEQKNAD
ncbi:Bromodomain [Carpediemonas membranifera]|uniref:Bromodomain n=1 Tax=Carpediemonas membranifera TaxID=201153 RepID=A0A8J6B9S8_9EUKA|nr:Bromodomain [Carpediemonas membranifera]|eukprot:KAG9395732.1 Bromodomain [Carpediemonas membranifera]